MGTGGAQRSNGSIQRTIKQIVEKDKDPEAKTDEDMSLVEIGPRFVLDVIRVFEGSFGGPTLFLNGNFISPNAVSSCMPPLLFRLVDCPFSAGPRHEEEAGRPEISLSHRGWPGACGTHGKHALAGESCGPSVRINLPGFPL